MFGLLADMWWDGVVGKILAVFLVVTGFSLLVCLGWLGVYVYHQITEPHSGTIVELYYIPDHYVSCGRGMVCPISESWTVVYESDGKQGDDEVSEEVWVELEVGDYYVNE